MNTISISTTRHHLSYINTVFQTYVHHLKNTNLVNVANRQMLTEEFLMAKIVNSLLIDLEILFTKKLVSSFATKVKLNFTEAQAIALYKVLLGMPILKDDHYCHMVRQHWIEVLEKQIIFFTEPPPPEAFEFYLNE